MTIQHTKAFEAANIYLLKFEKPTILLIKKQKIYSSLEYNIYWINENMIKHVSNHTIDSYPNKKIANYRNKINYKLALMYIDIIHAKLNPIIHNMRKFSWLRKYIDFCTDKFEIQEIVQRKILQLISNLTEDIKIENF